MIRFASRPTEGRRAFEERVTEHKTSIAALTRPDGSPDLEAIHAYLKSHEAWQSGVKPYFMDIQSRKCGYCEEKLTDSTGDIEHFRPKKAIFDLETPGREVESLVNLHGRRFRTVFSSGYWWLAYAWDNYLVACMNCNRKWKSALFPIEAPRTRAPLPGDETRENLLLLDPFGDQDPAEHLAFDALGQVEAYRRSPVGKKTIETCGLDRESLRSSREEKAARTYQLLGRLRAAISRTKKQEILEDLKLSGDISYRHAGMVRAIFEQETGLSWSILDPL